MDKDNSTSDVPNWINTDLLKKILCPHGKEDTIKSWKIERGTAPGDNYASIIYRVSVDLVCSEKLENKSLVIKVELINKEVSKIVSEGNAFAKEIHVYSTIIPQMNNMLEEIFPNKFQPFAPYCYYTHLGPPGSVLVFEDLKNESFKLAERTVGLDMRHSLLVVRSLAVYHASSVVLFEKQPDLFEPLKSSVYQKSSGDSLKSLLSPVLRDLAEELEKWPGYKEKFSEKLRNIADKSVDIILDGVTRDDGDFNVLAHEDPWLNNIMFRYSEDTGEVVDIRLVDFQSCHWLAPAIDIQRYLLSTATVEVVAQHDFILEEYFKVLRDTLDALGYIHLCPTIDHLKRQMDRRAMFGIVLGIVTRAFFLTDPGNFQEIDTIMKNETRIQFGKLFKEVIRKLLPILEKNNWI